MDLNASILLLHARFVRSRQHLSEELHGTRLRHVPRWLGEDAKGVQIYIPYKSRVHHLDDAMLSDEDDLACVVRAW